MKKSELKVGDRASLTVKYGDHKGLPERCSICCPCCDLARMTFPHAVWRLVARTGQYAVRIVGIEEKGLRIQHEKDDLEHTLLPEIKRQRRAPPRVPLSTGWL